jgi:hypothetical protein
MNKIIAFPGRGGNKEEAPQPSSETVKQQERSTVLFEFQPRSEQPFLYNGVTIPRGADLYDTSQILLNNEPADVFLEEAKVMETEEEGKNLRGELQKTLLFARAAYIEATVPVDDRHETKRRLVAYTKKLSDTEQDPALRLEARILESDIEGVSRAERDGEVDLYVGIAIPRASALYDEEELTFTAISVSNVTASLMEAHYDMDEQRQKTMENLQARLLRARESYIRINSSVSTQDNALRELAERAWSTAREFELPQLNLEVQDLLESVVGAVRAADIFKSFYDREEVYDREAIRRELDEIARNTKRKDGEEGGEKKSNPKEKSHDDNRSRFRIIK